MGWADKARTLGVRANADTPREAKQAREFGAEGIGLCRTEHMFFEESRILAMREMICADDEAGRRRALAKMLPMQRADFEALFEIMAGLPVTIRLLDPAAARVPAARGEGGDGRRQGAGRAAAEAAGARVGAARVQPHAGLPRLPSRHPLSRDHRDAGARHLRGRRQRGEEDRQARDARGDDPARRLSRRVRHPARGDREDGRGRREGNGQQARLPDRHHDRAAAGCAEGARDRRGRGGRRVLLVRHQRSDANLPWALARRRGAHPVQLQPSGRSSRWIPSSPSIATASASWCASATERGRKTRPDLKIGICGEHGGDPDSVAFCHEAGLDYVSCSAFRVPVARLAAAQAAIRAKRGQSPRADRSD